MKLEGIRLPQHGFSAPRLEHMFWQLIPEPVIGVHVYGLSPIGTDDGTQKNFLFDAKTEPPTGFAHTVKTTTVGCLNSFW